jgi:hypothetical protein
MTEKSNSTIFADSPDKSSAGIFKVFGDRFPRLTQYAIHSSHESRPITFHVVTAKTSQTSVAVDPAPVFLRQKNSIKYPVSYVGL